MLPQLKYQSPMSRSTGDTSVCAERPTIALMCWTVHVDTWESTVLYAASGCLKSGDESSRLSSSKPFGKLLISNLIGKSVHKAPTIPAKFHIQARFPWRLHKVLSNDYFPHWCPKSNSAWQYWNLLYAEASALTLSFTEYELHPEVAFKGYGSNLSPCVETCISQSKYIVPCLWLPNYNCSNSVRIWKSLLWFILELQYFSLNVIDLAYGISFPYCAALLFFAEAHFDAFVGFSQSLIPLLQINQFELSH